MHCLVCLVCVGWCELVGVRRSAGGGVHCWSGRALVVAGAGRDGRAGGRAGGRTAAAAGVQAKNKNPTQ